MNVWKSHNYLKTIICLLWVNYKKNPYGMESKYLLFFFVHFKKKWVFFIIITITYYDYDYDYYFSSKKKLKIKMMMWWCVFLEKKKRKMIKYFNKLQHNYFSHVIDLFKQVKNLHFFWSLANCFLVNCWSAFKRSICNKKIKIKY